MKGKEKWFFVVLAMVMLLLVSLPCEAASGKKISQKKAELFVGETVQLKITGSPKTVKWKSDNRKIASVSKYGLVTAKKTGNCKITAIVGKKKLTCSIRVTELPKNYATINGRRVKVGKTLGITYRLQSDKPICNISIKYTYDFDAIQIVNADKASRYPTWVCNESYPRCTDPDDANALCDIYHLVGVDQKDVYNVANISCSQAKVLDSMKVKVRKSGNYIMKLDLYYVSNASYEKVKKFKVTETIK